MLGAGRRVWGCSRVLLRRWQSGEAKGASRGEEKVLKSGPVEAGESSEKSDWYYAGIGVGFLVGVGVPWFLLDELRHEPWVRYWCDENVPWLVPQLSRVVDVRPSWMPWESEGVDVLGAEEEVEVVVFPSEAVVASGVGDTQVYRTKAKGSTPVGALARLSGGAEDGMGVFRNSAYVVDAAFSLPSHVSFTPPNHIIEVSDTQCDALEAEAADMEREAQEIREKLQSPALPPLQQAKLPARLAYIAQRAADIRKNLPALRYQAKQAKKGRGINEAGGGGGASGGGWFEGW